MLYWRMTWPSIEASRMCRKQLNMHTQAACVVEQVWILHERCSIGKDKLRLRSNKADEKYIRGLIPLN